MGFNPFKSVGKAVKGITKPFKKVLRSPIGKAAAMWAMYNYGPMMGGHETGFKGWQKMFPKLLATEAPVIGGYPSETSPVGIGKVFDWMGKNKALTAAGLAVGAGAVGDDVLEEKKTVIDDSGHRGYLNARKGFVDEWTEWLIDQGHDEVTARAMAEKELFAKAEGGIVGLAQGGRIGMAEGWPGPGVAAEERAAIGKAAADAWNSSPKGKPGMLSTPQQQAEQFASRPVSQGHANEGWQTYAIPPKKPSLGHRIDDAATRFLPNWLRRTPNIKARQKWAKAKGFLSGDPLGVHAPLKGYEWMEDEDIVSSAAGLELFRELGYVPASDLHGQGGEGEGPQAEWRRLGYPSYEAYLAAMQGGGGGGGGTPTDTVGDYYGFKEWEDWTGGPTTPLFGGDTQYQGLLSKGGRIGLYAGGMGAMNNPMNPMMNQGLGAMGSPGMNPYNQQNLMQHSQMRGQPQGRPPMPGGPTTAQGPGITGTQAGAALAKKEDDGDLLKLIRMLASMGIPMEQLRGRTKEELVEMVMSLSAKAESQGGGQEVIEEQEEVVEAAHGGRVRAAGGLGEMYPPQGSYPNSDLEFQTEEQASMGNPGNAEMYVEDEEEEIYMPRAQGGLMRTGYAMGTEQPIIPSRDGPQIDYRGIGGYQPHGAKEKKDDVRALLAQGEFVVTSDAVKGIGEGDRDLGAKRMYDMMHKYEPIGRALS